MNIQVFDYPNWKTADMELAVAAEFKKYNADEMAQMMGRLFVLLVEKGCITVEEVGNVFYEVWIP